MPSWLKEKRRRFIARRRDAERRVTRELGYGLTLRWLESILESRPLPSGLTEQQEILLEQWSRALDGFGGIRRYYSPRHWHKLKEVMSGKVLWEPVVGLSFEEAILDPRFSFKERLEWGQQAFEIYEHLSCLEPRVGPSVHTLAVVNDTLLLTPDLEVLLGLYPARPSLFELAATNPEVCPFLYAVGAVICLSLSHGEWREGEPHFEGLVGKSLNELLRVCLDRPVGHNDWQPLSTRYLLESERLISKL